MKKYSITVMLVIGFMSNLFSQTNDQADSVITNQKVKSKLDSAKSTQTKGNIIVENRGAILIARIDGGPHALLDQEIAKQLKELVDKVDKDPNIHAVVFTGTHPDRFLSHSDVTWLQQGGVGFPHISTGTARRVSRIARRINKTPIVRSLARKTKLKTLLQLDNLHATFLKMNASGTVFIAAINGTALAIGAELAWACDIRIMAEGDYVIGLTEVLLSLTPGGGGSQRLPRLIGMQQSLNAILEGRPFTPAEALALGAVDEVVPQNKVVERSIKRAEYLSLRSKMSIGAIKRSIYFGSSMEIEKGLQFEHGEFLVRDQSKEAQQLMLDYIATTAATGELPLLNKEKYAQALDKGHIGEVSAIKTVDSKEKRKKKKK
jgi:enoyl-CoA hydratase/carnithine racemase